MTHLSQENTDINLHFSSQYFSAAAVRDSEVVKAPDLRFNVILHSKSSEMSEKLLMFLIENVFLFVFYAKRFFMLIIPFSLHFKCKIS